ncbi:hypothetical protein D3C84_1233270 [compost metagenome]
MVFFAAVLISVENLVDVFGQQPILTLAVFEVLGSVDEQHVIGLFALLQHQNAYRNASREEQVGRQADHRVDMAIL